MSDTAAIAITADEFYTFAGDPDTNKPPYWVARHGCTVTMQIRDDAPTVDTFNDVPTARAEFAEATCDPDDAGAPQVGDTVDAFDWPGQFTVTAVDRRTGQGGWPVFYIGGHRSGTVEASYATYWILSRPEVSS